jgi:hypothetical protein
VAVTGYWVDLGGSKWRCKSFKTQAGSIEKAHLELYSKSRLLASASQNLLVCIWVCTVIITARLDLLESVAEEERFELSEDFHPRWFSRPVHSTTLPPLRGTVENLTIISATVNRVLSINSGCRNALILGGLRVSLLAYLKDYCFLSY